MLEKILEWFSQSNFKEIKNCLADLNEVDIAELLEQILEEEDGSNVLITVFRMLPKEMASEVFSYLDKEVQQVIIEAITDREVCNIVDSLFMDDTVDFLEEMPANVVKRVLKHTDKDTRELINQLLQYPEDSAGSIMTTEFIDLHANMTVGQALSKIRKTGIDKATIYNCYIITKDRKLLGEVELKDMMVATDDQFIEDIMESNPIIAHTLDDQENVANSFGKYGVSAMPVVDQENRLVGVITSDDVMAIMQEEATEDMEMMSAMTPSEKPYLKTGVFSLAKHRIVWLLVLMISATFTGSIMNHFEELISSMAILASFIPMLMDTGGNAGSQSSTLIIRGMALEEIHSRDILRVIWKEVRVALIAGIVLAIVNFGRIILMNLFTASPASPMVAFVVSFSLLCIVVLAKLVGCTLPILAKQLHLDPAIMASPLITTIVDAVALIIYFMMAKLMLGL